jgi:hypothetical protein
MRADLVRARRRRVVREAALAWKSAGAIDDAGLAAVDVRYPEDRVRQRPVWRILIYLFTGVICSAVAGLAALMLVPVIGPTPDAAAMLLLVFGAALVFATEIEQGPWRFDGTGAEAATSFLAPVFLIAGIAVHLVDRPHSPAAAIGATLAAAALLWGGAWWRWGFPLYALFAAGCAFFGVLELPGPVRIFWIAAGTALSWIAASLQDRPSLAPPQRDGCRLVLAASLSAIYAALNLYSLDHRFLESLRPGAAPPSPALPFVRTLSILATALLPAAVLAAGWRRKRRLLVDLGLAFAAISFATLRAFVHLGPLWLVLCAAGTVLIVAAAFGERFLSRERFGWTAESLAGEDAAASGATTLAAAVVLSPDARPAGGSGLTPGGGRYGGGGASGEF